MLRLRTTSGLSMLALLIGIAGTGWLSSLSVNWSGPQSRMSTARTQGTPRWHGPIHVVPAHRVRAVRGGDRRGEETAALASAAPALIPLSMPAGRSPAWEQMRGHLDGQLVLQLDINADGHVAQARLRHSSGDAVLDAYALRNVRNWRFAVPADHPAGITGDLPMHFSSRDERIAQAP